MSKPSGTRAFADLERNTADVIEAIHLAGRLLRALAPLALEMRELQDALLQLQDATSPALTAPALPVAGPPPAATV